VARTITPRERSATAKRTAGLGPEPDPSRSAGRCFIASRDVLEAGFELEVFDETRGLERPGRQRLSVDIGASVPADTVVDPA
jgi:hypothetical protein